MRNVWKKWMGMALAGAMLVQTGGALVFAAGEDETAGISEEYVALEQMKSVTADSYQPGYEPDKAVDGIEDDPNNCWHSPWEADPP